MTLWTIQPINVWETLQSEGVWRARQPFIDDPWPVANAWMADKLRERAGPRELEDQIPVWAWFQWFGEHKRMPDLRARCYRRLRHSVRIQLEVSESRVLLSDFELWNCVINYW